MGGVRDLDIPPNSRRSFLCFHDYNPEITFYDAFICYLAVHEESHALPSPVLYPPRRDIQPTPARMGPSQRKYDKANESYKV